MLDKSQSARRLREVCWTLDATTTSIEHVGVDHRRADVAMSQQFLNRADVIPIFEQMGREGVALMPSSALAA